VGMAHEPEEVVKDKKSINRESSLMLEKIRYVLKY